MMVWAGCLTCKTQGRLIGQWADEADVTTLDPAQMHQLQEHEVTVTGSHLDPLHPFTLEDFGVPANITDGQRESAAWWAGHLDKTGVLAQAAQYATRRGLTLWDMNMADFERAYAGQYDGKVTRALRKNFVVTPAGKGWSYLWRKTA